MSTLASTGLHAADSTPVTLAPTPGFVVKSVTTTAGYFSAKPPTPTSSNVLLEPTSPLAGLKTLQIPQGIKVFLNIAWDAHVPPPPSADEAVVRRAMMGEDLDDAGGIGAGAYYVPVVVSEPREDKDKGAFSLFPQKRVDGEASCPFLQAESRRWCSTACSTRRSSPGARETTNFACISSV